MSPSVYSKDGVDFALLFTLRESRRTSDSALFRLRRTVGYYGFTLDALTLKPSDFCNVGVNPAYSVEDLKDIKSK
jgi:hypothetical protein